uniref:Translation initiation factor 5A C-terminal domain-containing protein n=1 Tax=Lactuca sativa TaxID=4236 RepID=A0A9R1UX25_LACSA|nr:hypothetical protein LSAT_V11C700373960 [Lactuca sativa]
MADVGASKTYPQQAGTIRKNGYIVIKNRALKGNIFLQSQFCFGKALCRVVEVSTSKTGKHGHAKCHFLAIDISNGKKLEDIVPSSHNCDVPHVNRTDYQLIDISEDGFVSLLTENGNTKDDLKLSTDDAQLTQAFFFNFLKKQNKGRIWKGEGPICDFYVSNRRGTDLWSQGHWPHVYISKYPQTPHYNML